jgi:subtilisin family serine protease
MRTRSILLLACALCSCLILPAQPAAVFQPDALIVQFKPGTPVQLEHCLALQRFGHPALDSLGARHGIRRISLTGNPYTRLAYLLEFRQHQDVPALAAAYLQTGFFAFAEPNYQGEGGGQRGTQQILPNDGLFYLQWGLHNTGVFPLAPATAGADIGMPLAWDIEQGDSSIVLAILDSGIKLDHPEFSGRIWRNADETQNGADDDGNGYADDLRGWDFANGDNNPSDDHGHGTNVAGIACASGSNQIGYAGVDWNCKVMACKILNNNNIGYYSWWADAIYYATRQGARVINMSVGGDSFSALLRDAVVYAHSQGVVVVACMMNQNIQLPYYPAAFPTVVAVGATSPTDTRAVPFFWSASSGSNFGDHIDVVAPGNYIYGLNYQSNTDYYTYWGGTSQAAPHVAGLAALLLAQDPARTPDAVHTILTTTADDEVGPSFEDAPGYDDYFGHGRINAHRALSLAALSAGPAPERLLMYPNPASDAVRIPLEPGDRSLRVLNQLGQPVWEQTWESAPGAVHLDTRHWPAGLYDVQAWGRSPSASPVRRARLAVR